METRNHILNSIPLADRHAIIPQLKTINLLAGDILFEPDQIVDRVYFPNTAVLSVVTVMSDGRLVETDTVGNESAVGLMGCLGSSVSIDRTFTQIAGAVVSLGAPELRQRAEQSPALRSLLLRHAQANLAQAHQSVACNALHTAEQRLCRWLLTSQDRTFSDVVGLTQQYLATMVGVQRTTVTQALRDLTAMGLIQQGRGQVRILKRKALEARSCECYAAVCATANRLIGVEPNAMAKTSGH